MEGHVIQTDDKHDGKLDLTDRGVIIGERSKVYHYVAYHDILTW